MYTRIVNMKIILNLMTVPLLAAVACSGTAQSAEAPAENPATPRVDYELTGDISLGAPSFNDCITFDPDAHRLYVSHVDRVTVVDVATRTVVGSIGPFKDSHGIAIVTKLGKGYADSGDDGVVKAFNLVDFKVLKEIKVSADADGM